ncbi:amidohydrolase [Synoicihabitans lomoniglobus]|uniref:Amidohydrolase n=1 Tax=Synoicihabitans lomoniglobus TaxID=2909285 RepID=A0AAF0CM52_9BACT|nr:amidohydrolase [Opitutaceae bacterium LMO-M01]WED63633.1 amidohydrolase [Opitutaceae bacterium LMO-M01]
MTRLLFWLALGGSGLIVAASPTVDRRAEAIEADVIAWRHHLHAHPELSNEEKETAAYIAQRLERIGVDELKTGVAGHGVVALIKGTKPGPVVALRADMDALPVTEQTGLPYASTVRANYGGKEVGVMHACGHDAHVAILLGAAEVLAGMRDELTGSVKLIFQPAEEGAYPAPKWGAKLMIEEGVLEQPTVDAIFGLHVWSGEPSGTLSFRSGPFMASSDFLRITVTGRQTHAARPWGGIDPITVSAQIVLGLQTIASRQVNILAGPSLVSIGTISGGERNNIIPDEVVMTGTIRTFDPDVRAAYHERIKTTAESIAAASGATAEVYIGSDTGYSPTINDPELTAAMADVFTQVVGAENVKTAPMVTPAEDFSFYQEKVPGLYFSLGVCPPDIDPATAASNHSPRFVVDDAALVTGVRAMATMAVEYLARHAE